MTTETESPVFEVTYRGERWRFAVSTYGSEPRLNCRAFFQLENGEWRPCSSRSGKGFTMPLQRARELGTALAGLPLSQEGREAPEAPQGR
jgi:hypothetical protein